MLPICTKLCSDQFPEKERSVREDSLDAAICFSVCKFHWVFIFICLILFLHYTFTFLSLSTSVCTKYFVHHNVDAPSPPGLSSRQKGVTDVCCVLCMYYVCMYVAPIAGDDTNNKHIF